MKVASDLALALDAALFAQRCGLDPDPWQADVLRSTSGRLILNCARQTGKSTTAAQLALWTAIYQGPRLILLLSPTLRQSSELFRKVAASFASLGQDAPPTSAETLLRLELANGSRIISLPGKEETIRGYSGVDLLIVDEAARTPSGLYQACRPMLATSGGRIVLLSTPCGRRGFFFEEWTKGAGWERVKVTAYDCPRISDEWLEEEKATLGPLVFSEEYLCEFQDAAWALWPTEYLDQLFNDPTVREWDI